jgi:2-methylisocitrate lyase-like PEP mutase family enzyme
MDWGLPDTGLSSYSEMLDQGATPVLAPRRLEEIGYRIAAYPLTLLNSAVYAMRRRGALISLPSET